MKPTKKSDKKKQMNFRVPAYLAERISKGAKANGITQVQFVERCVILSAEGVADMTDKERAALRAQLNKIQDDAKLNK